MAKAPAAPAADDAPAPKKSKKLLIIVVALVLVVVLAVGGVVGLLLMKKGSGSGDQEAAHDEADSGAAAVDLSKPPTFVALDPFVVNLAREQSDRYLQVVIALRVGDPKTGEGLKGYMPEIRHRINMILSSKLPSELSTPEGREDLAFEIQDEVNDVLGFPPGRGNRRGPSGPIQSVLFNSFIIQ